METLKQQLEVAQQWAESIRDEKSELEKEYLLYQRTAAEKENDFKGLSDAYSALVEENYRLEEENKSLRSKSSAQGGGVDELEAAREEGRKEAQKEGEAELNDLLVLLGQEETKVERLTGRLRELDEDVDKLLEGIGEADDGDEDDDDDEDES